MALCSETWEKSNNKKYQKNIEEMLEMKGLRMISNPRKYQRGGGVCIIANTTKVNIQAVETPNPDNVEAVFALVKPLAPSPQIKTIITFAFYCPPRSRKMSKLIDYLVTNIHSLLTRYPDAGIMGGGDRNSLNLSPILAAVPRMQNIQQLPSLKEKNLDVLLTNMAPLYSIPIIAPPVLCDDPNKGVPSDHSVPIAYPITSATLGKLQKYKERTTRPLPESAVRQFGLALIEQDWTEMKSNDSSEKQEMTMQNILTSLIEEHCPTKTVKLRPQTDKPFITNELKTLDRKRKREYRKHRKSEKYCYLNELFNAKYSKASKDYLEKMMFELEESNPAKANKLIKRLGAQPGEMQDEGNFSLPDHQNLTAEQSANRIAQKFSEISQEYPPITVEKLPERVQTKIKNAQKHAIPYVSRQMVEEKIKKAKTTKGGVDGDLPAKLIKEFSSELAPPLAQLYRTIAQTGKWPSRWKAEQGLPLKKIANPLSEDDLRIISLTPFFSKTFEQLTLDWLLKYVGEQLDSFQYGGRKGTSINHYLIDLITFILFNQDLPETKAVLATMIDFSKAFNRQNHLILVTKLSDMGVPGWLLKIIIGFLEERELVVIFNGAKSGAKDMPGGGPQGTVLGMFLFLILINKAGFSDQSKRLGDKLTAAASKRDEITKMHAKYVDDMTTAHVVNLKNDLETNDERVWMKPPMRRERFEKVLPENKNNLQHQMKELCNYAIENEMKLNKDKTKVMLFNTAKHSDFMPEITVDDEQLEVVEEFKLLGVKITSNLKWEANTDYITKKAYKRLWLLRRLKKLGMNTRSLVKVFTTQVRSVLEFGAVTWHPMLTLQNSKSIERVQKSALAIILSPNYRSYDEALAKTELERLDRRREKLSLNFAKKAAKHPEHSNWFCKQDLNTNMQTRSTKAPYKPVQARTQRLLNSPIPYFTQLLNADATKTNNVP